MNSEQSRSTGAMTSLGHVVTLLRPHSGRIALALLALLVGSGINLVFPEVVRRALNPDLFPAVLENLPLFFGLLAALFAIQGGAFFVRSLIFGLLGQQVYADVRERLFRSVIGREIAFFDRHRSGDLASRLNSDAALVQDLVSVKLSVILRYGVQVLFGTALMAWMSWQMTVAIVASVICMVIVSGAFVRSLRAASRRFQNTLADLTGFAGESFAGAKVIRALGAETNARESFTARSSEVLRAGQGRVRISAAFSSGASLLLNILLLGVVGYGVSLVVDARLPISDLAAFALYGSIVAISFTFLVSAYSEVAQSLGGLDRVFELFDEGRHDDELMTEIISHKGPRLSLKEVSFAYPGRSESVVLDKLSLEIEPGSLVGIMGPSGAGKSSIVQLLLKFYEPTSGSILINDRPLSDVSNNELRAKVAWVPQEPLLFGVSILENLTLGRAGLSRDDVEAHIKEWEFLDFIWDLPGDLSMVLGEHGTTLSGGQRQRIAIARALLRAPQLLFLDEATSGLDSELEDKALSVIRRVLPNSTIVVVSHRLSSIRGADTIFMINEGRVTEQGTHNELKNAAGLYHHYVQRQAVG